MNMKKALLVLFAALTALGSQAQGEPKMIELTLEERQLV